MLIPGLILLYLLFCCQLSQVEVKVQGVYEKLWFAESTASLVFISLPKNVRALNAKESVQCESYWLTEPSERPMAA